MRVIAGTAKGHRLRSPKRSPLRPTSELVRGAIFSLLESAASDWSRVLDLYAGSGALGIEALSRGAGWADFVEQEPRCCAIIKENLRRTGFVTRSHVYCTSAAKALSLLGERYGIILLDPPYNNSSLPDMVDKLFSSGLVGEESTIVVEHSRRLPLKEAYGQFRRVRSLRHGDTCVSAYQCTGGEP